LKISNENKIDSYSIVLLTRTLLFCFNFVFAFAFTLIITVQVDQDVDEPWPLEVYGHDGKATNITMEPGTLIVC
jgi:hypothetical protein